jgi:hypothetical protein
MRNFIGLTAATALAAVLSAPGFAAPANNGAPAKTIAHGVPGAPGGTTAIGPKPDEPLNPSSRTRQTGASDGPGMSGTNGTGHNTHGIIIEGRNTHGIIIEGHTKTGGGTTAIGPKPDEPRNPSSKTSTGPLVNPKSDAHTPAPH